ncbi:hypothetical protein DBO85_18780 [Pseudomonas mangrovi]|uniref:Uncharacterized protein n=1 Tax=Pseudomonas mangrovi TaxID=2161748 RepID=A0A2T5P531_9PSED|nr:hypothetical protein DBO85_18780 [Pseudomonas mangrovi]
MAIESDRGVEQRDIAYRASTARRHLNPGNGLRYRRLHDAVVEALKVALHGADVVAVAIGFNEAARIAGAALTPTGIATAVTFALAIA